MKLRIRISWASEVAFVFIFLFHKVRQTHWTGGRGHLGGLKVISVMIIDVSLDFIVHG